MLGSLDPVSLAPQSNALLAGFQKYQSNVQRGGVMGLMGGGGCKGMFNGRPLSSLPFEFVSLHLLQHKYLLVIFRVFLNIVQANI